MFESLDWVPVSTLIGLISYAIYFVSKTDIRLFRLADRQEKEIARVQDELRETQEELREAKDLAQSYMIGTRILVQQIRNMGHNPNWVPYERLPSLEDEY